MKSVLLTRNLEENLVLERKLNKNFSTINLPLIKHEKIEIDFRSIKKSENVILTSGYAAKLLNEAEEEKAILLSKKFWVVGQKTKEILQRKGLNVVQSAANVEDLDILIPKELYSSTIYLSGDQITKPFPPQIERQIIYTTHYTQKLNTKNIEEIKKKVDYIVLFSQNCSRTLLELLKNYNLTKFIEDSVVVAVSSSVASILMDYCKRCLYCNKGKQKQLMDILLTDARKR